jgi:hypothetical protein
MALHRALWGDATAISCVTLRHPCVTLWAVEHDTAATLHLLATAAHAHPLERRRQTVQLVREPAR